MMPVRKKTTDIILPLFRIWEVEWKRSTTVQPCPALAKGAHCLCCLCERCCSMFSFDFAIHCPFSYRKKLRSCSFSKHNILLGDHIFKLIFWLAYKEMGFILIVYACYYSLLFTFQLKINQLQHSYRVSEI